MKTTDVALLDEVFTHIDEKDGHQTSYNATQLAAHLSSIEWGQVFVPVEEGHARFCLQYRGVEQVRVERLAKCPEAAKRPIIFIELGDVDRSHLLVDGTHRYVLYFLLKLPHIPAYIVPLSIAKDFIIEDAPQMSAEDLMKDTSVSRMRALLGDSQ